MKADADLTVPARNSSHAIHHPVFCVKMKEKADAAGMECHLQVGKAAPAPPSNYADAAAFLESLLLAKAR